MKSLDKSVLIEVLGGLEEFNVVYTAAEIWEMNAPRYIGFDMDTNYSVFETTEGALIAVEG